MYRVEFNIGTTCDYKEKINYFKKAFEEYGFKDIETSFCERMANKEPLFCYDITGYRELLRSDIETIGHITEGFMLLFDEKNIIGAVLVIKNLSSEKGELLSITNLKPLKETVIFTLNRKAEYLGL